MADKNEDKPKSNKPLYRPAKLNNVKPMMKKPSKRARRFLRTPLFWLITGIAVLLLFSHLSTSGPTFTKVDTSKIVDAIQSQKVDSAILVDRDQKIEAILKPGVTIDGASQVYANYITNQEPGLVSDLIANPPPKAWDVKIPTQSFLVTALLNVLPILVIGFLLLLFMGNAQGGNRVFSFGQIGRAHV